MEHPDDPIPVRATDASAAAPDGRARPDRRSPHAPRLPRLGGGGGVRRHATWLELFFDLVFVLAIAELAGVLHEDTSPAGIKHFALLFVPVWWLWMGFSYYADQFDSEEEPDSPAFRVTMLAAMLGTVVLAVTVHDALAGGSAWFAATYGTLRVLLTGLYVSAGRHVPEARALCGRYATGFAVGAALWLGSLAAPGDWRYLVWAVALVIEIATPVVAYFTTPTVPAQQSHMPERFGLFTLIVLGEAIVVVGSGLAESTAWAWRSTSVGVCGFVIAACLWWIYFDRVDDEAISRAVSDGGYRALARSFVYGYNHLFIYAGIAATAVGMELAIAEAAHGGLTGGARAVGGGGIAVYLVALAASQRASSRGLPGRVFGARLVVAAAVSGLAVLGDELDPPVLSGLVALALVGLTTFERVTAPAAEEIAGDPEYGVARKAAASPVA